MFVGTECKEEAGPARAKQEAHWLQDREGRVVDIHWSGNTSQLPVHQAFAGNQCLSS